MEKSYVLAISNDANKIKDKALINKLINDFTNYPILDVDNSVCDTDQVIDLTKTSLAEMERQYGQLVVVNLDLEEASDSLDIKESDFTKKQKEEWLNDKPHYGHLYKLFI